MRFLQLCNDGFDYKRLFAVMIAPNNENLRNSFLRMEIEAGRLPDTQSIPPVPLSAAVDAYRIKETAERMSRLGFLAGGLLGVYAQMGSAGVREPSQRKASRVLELYYSGKSYGGNRGLMRASDRQISGVAMNECRDVAHLWAASQVIAGTYGKSKAKELWKTKRGSQEFLKIAAHFLDFGLTAQPRRTNKRMATPLLNPKTAWRIPTYIKPYKDRVPVLNREIYLSLRGYSHI